METNRLFVQISGFFIEILGVLIIVIAAVASLIIAIRAYYFKKTHHTVIYTQLRQRFGRGILLGLEFLVAADIIKSVSITPSLASVGTLAVIVIIRTFLSFVLDVEMYGKWPWRSK